MDTAVICIGNSDDKLTQQEWSEFVTETHALIISTGYQIYFHGFPPGDMPWQNACWVLGFDNDLNTIIVAQLFRRELAKLCDKYRQDSIAFTLGDTVMVTSHD